MHLNRIPYHFNSPLAPADLVKPTSMSTVHMIVRGCVCGLCQGERIRHRRVMTALTCAFWTVCDVFIKWGERADTYTHSTICCVLIFEEVNVVYVSPWDRKQVLSLYCHSAARCGESKGSEKLKVQPKRIMLCHVTLCYVCVCACACACLPACV